MSTILLTGASGYLGSSLRDYLQKHHTVHAIMGRQDFSTQVDEMVKNYAIDIVIHAGFSVSFSAATEERSLNVQNFEYLVQRFREFPNVHFIHLGAAGAYGVSSRKTIRDESCWANCDSAFQAYQNSQYIHDKIACERYQRVHWPSATTLALTTVLGKGMPKGTLEPLASSSPFFLCPPGGTSYLTMENLFEAIDLVLEKRPKGDFLINSKNLTFKEFFLAAAEAKGTKRTPIVIPAIVFYLLQKFTPRGFLSVIKSSFGFKWYSSDRAQKQWGFRPKEIRDDVFKELLSS